MLKKFTLTVAATLALATQAYAEQPLSIKVYNAPEASFSVNSTLVTGEKDAVLLDTGFTRSDALRIAANVLDSGKNLKTIFISQADPDYYFGAEVLHNIFPEAQVLSTPEVIKTIESHLKAKVEFWGPKMGNNAPKNPLIPSAMTGNTINLEGKTLEVRGTTGILAHRPYVWIPSIKTIAGDVNTYANMHVWMADTATPAARQAWVKRLDEMKALKPNTVVPGHMTANSTFSPKVIDDTRNYIVTFEKNLAKSKNSTQLIEAMKAAYPKAAEVSTLELGAKVSTGEMKW